MYITLVPVNNFNKIMKESLKINLILFLFIFVGLFSCKKQDIEPTNYIDVEINKQNTELTSGFASISNGIAILAGSNISDYEKSTMIISINGDRKGKYLQNYDYKTNVSISQCALTYKTISKSKTSTPQFFSSYEGKVTISEINMKEKKISGSYSFRVKSIPATKNVQEIKGKFYNVGFK